jgi:hypothetical protein
MIPKGILGEPGGQAGGKQRLSRSEYRRGQLGLSARSIFAESYADSLNNGSVDNFTFPLLSDDPAFIRRLVNMHAMPKACRKVSK